MAQEEAARVLGTEPFRMALDTSGGGIAHWKHDPLHDVVAPMTHHVIMAYNGAVQRMEQQAAAFVDAQVSVSDSDTDLFRQMGMTNVLGAVPTGVDCDFFQPPAAPPSSFMSRRH